MTNTESVEFIVYTGYILDWDDGKCFLNVLVVTFLQEKPFKLQRIRAHGPEDGYEG